MKIFKMLHKYSGARDHIATRTAPSATAARQRRSSSRSLNTLECWRVSSCVVVIIATLHHHHHHHHHHHPPHAPVMLERSHVNKHSRRCSRSSSIASTLTDLRPSLALNAYMRATCHNDALNACARANCHKNALIQPPSRAPPARAPYIPPPVRLSHT